jgi:hypothetical protein
MESDSQPRRSPFFRVANEQAEDWFAVLGLDSQGRVEATFRADGSYGLLSPDGSRAAVLGDRLYLVELGACRFN